MAPRPAGCPILTRKSRIGVASAVGPSAGLWTAARVLANYRWTDALPRRPPARPRRGPARTPRRRPLPLARGRRRPAARGPGPRPRTPLAARGARRAAAARASSPRGSSSWCTPARSASRCGAAQRAFSTRRDPGQEHAVAARPRARRHPARAGRPDGARPGRHHDAGRLVAVVGGRPAGLPALHRRRRGVPALRPRRGDRRGASTGRSTAAATPPSRGCPAATSCSTSAGWRRTRCPPARSSSTAGSGATASAPRPTTTCWSTARAATRPSTSACTRAATAAGWWCRGSAGTAPRDDVWIADLAGGRPRCGEFQVGRGRPDRGMGRPRRPAVADVRPRRPALAAGRRRSGRPGHVVAGGLAGRRPAAAGRRPLRRRPGRRRRTARCRCWPCTRSTRPTGCRSGPADGSGRLADVEGLGAGSISGVSAPPEGGTVGLGRLHRLRHAAVGAAAGTPATPTTLTRLGAGGGRRRGARP